MRLLHLQILALILCSAAMQILHLVSAKARAFLVQKDTCQGAMMSWTYATCSLRSLCHLSPSKVLSLVIVSQRRMTKTKFLLSVFFFSSYYLSGKRSLG